MGAFEGARGKGAYEVAASVAPLPPGVLAAALTFDGTSMHSSHVAECPELGPLCATSTPPKAYQHDLRNWAYGLTLDAQLGVLPWLAVSATVPLRAVTTTVKYLDLDGQPYDPVPPDPHHRDRTLMGLGDPALLAILGRSSGPLGFSVRLGALLPLGLTQEDDPEEAGEEGRAHEHVQFGAGSVRPLGGASLAYDFGRFGVDGWFLGTLSLTENAHGYRAGQRIQGGARASSALGLERLRFGVGVEMSHETTETWHGKQGDDGNLGRTDFTALATFRWAAGDRLGVFGALRVPLYTHAVGVQLSYPLILTLGVATRL